MNNKKLFKGALVLFASILMAVSCSNNSTDGGADGNGGNSNTGGNTTKPTINLQVKESKNTDKETTLVGILMKKTISDNTANLKANTTIELKGTDASKLDSGYKATVIGIKGVTLTKTAATAQAPQGITWANVNTKKDFSELDITTSELSGIVTTLKSSNLEISGMSKAVADKIIAKLTTSSGTGSDTTFGTIELKVKISKDDNTSEPVTLTIYFDVVHGTAD